MAGFVRGRSCSCQRCMRLSTQAPSLSEATGVPVLLVWGAGWPEARLTAKLTDVTIHRVSIAKCKFSAIKKPEGG